MRGFVISFVLVFASALTGCTHEHASSAPRRYSAADLERSLGIAEGVGGGYLIGEFKLAQKNAILDGDTIRVEGLKGSLRLLAIDTEETFKRDSERWAYAKGFDAYVKGLRGNSKRPVKMATPLGEEAKEWAEDFFRGVTKVKLERDHPEEVIDYYDRYLAYVFAWKDGEWVNYNVECVRAGMSPYFQKYSRSRRFHEAFLQAQEEARQAGVGIWDPKKEHYPDYDERLEWWDARGEFIWRFEQMAEGRDDHIALTRHNVDALLAAREGQEVVLFGAVGSVREREKGPSTISLSRRRFSDFPVLFWKAEVLEATGAKRHRGEYALVRGQLSRYTSGSGRSTLQVEVRDPAQVTLLVPGEPWPLGDQVPAASPLPTTPAANEDVEIEAALEEAIRAAEGDEDEEVEEPSEIEESSEVEGSADEGAVTPLPSVPAANEDVEIEGASEDEEIEAEGGRDAAAEEEVRSHG